MDLRTLIDSRPVVVGDGAMGTQLIERGLPVETCGELWNVENPDAVVGIQRAYVEAGADFLITNTFGANAVVCARHGLGDMVAQVNVAAVHVAREASGDLNVLVLGGLGPTGSLLEPYGDLTPEQATAAYREQVESLAGAGVDGIICETFESSEELRLALCAAREVSDLPLVASMKFNQEHSGRYRSMMGEAPAALADVARECGCVAAGANCISGIEAALPLVSELAELLDVPLLVEPNAGVPRLAGGVTAYPQDAAFFARNLQSLYDAGARIIGGCCGTTPEHVRAVREFANSL